MPWTAAISAGAPVVAGIQSVFVDFRTAYPNALGLSALLGAPMAMHCRGGRAWGGIGIGVAADVVLLLVAKSCVDGGRDGQFLVMLQFLLFVPLAVFGIPAAALVLALSGEWLALAQGTSVASLPRGGLRVALLLLLILSPLALYASNRPRDCVSGPGFVRFACDRLRSLAPCAARWRSPSPSRSVLLVAGAVVPTVVVALQEAGRTLPFHDLNLTLALAFFHNRTYREHELGRGPCSTCFRRPSEDSPSRRH